MRIAIVSDTHGNRRAFQAVLGDLGHARRPNDPIRRHASNGASRYQLSMRRNGID